MKKITAFLVFLFAVIAFYTDAQNPIPSWNTPVYHQANFQELVTGSSNPAKTNRGKQILHVSAHRTSAPQPNCGTVWIYCLDTLEVIGPFQLCDGESLSAEIDERQWGVFIESESHLVVDVWIE